MHNTVVICPVYNESSSLEQFLDRLAACCDADLCFVDDGSTDRSTAVIRDRAGVLAERVELLSHGTRKGYGAALMTGFQFALREGYARIITLDADLQHRPEDIDRFKGELDSCDVALGSRYLLPVGLSRVPHSRYLINRYIAGMLERYCSVRFSDPFCGFRAYRSTLLEGVALRERSYGICLEMLMEILRLGAIFHELPIEMIYHDPARNFLDGLDDPKKRLDYYRGIIRNRIACARIEGVSVHR